MGKRRHPNTDIVRNEDVTFSIERGPFVVTRVATSSGARYTVIPTTIEGGAECVVVGTSKCAFWIGQALAVNGDFDRSSIDQFAQDVIRALLAQTMQADAPRARPSLEGSDDELALGPSDQSTTDSDGDAPARNCSNTSLMLEEEARQSCLKEYSTVMIDGVAISAKLRCRPRKGVLVPNDPHHLANLMKVLRARVPEGSNSDVEARASKRQVLTEEKTVSRRDPQQKEWRRELHKKDTCVRYYSLPQAGVFRIFYKNEKDQAEQASFLVARKDKDGKMLTGEAFACNLESVGNTAIAAWNERDMSGLPRLT